MEVISMPENNEKKTYYKKTQSKSVVKYISNNYDQISVRIPKGSRERYKAFAEKRGTSLNSLIVELLEREMNNEE